MVLVKWTIDGASATATSCAGHPSLYLQFDGADSGDTLRFEPVACNAGQLNVDKIAKRYQQVELGVAGSSANVAPIDPVTSQAQFDLFR
ncbi:MAG TPA: hypothetical protein VIX73_15510 [Kofleriaceae bacterium]